MESLLPKTSKFAIKKEDKNANKLTDMSGQECGGGLVRSRVGGKLVWSRTKPPSPGCLSEELESQIQNLAKMFSWLGFDHHPTLVWYDWDRWMVALVTRLYT